MDPANSIIIIVTLLDFMPHFELDNAHARIGSRTIWKALPLQVVHNDYGAGNRGREGREGEREVGGRGEGSCERSRVLILIRLTCSGGETPRQIAQGEAKFIV